MKWYENCYRRHLADMHIEDWNPEFLRDFSPEAYVENLKIAKVQTPMIYLQSHVGCCNYPTATGKTHAAMRENPSKIQRLIDLCHGAGMNVVGYYSLIYNTWAHDTYPGWRMVNQEGKSVRMREKGFRYGFCCPNNGDYREFTFKQIDEIADTFRLEGIFFDMLFWPDFCYCPSCRARYLKETGLTLPEKENWQDENWKTFVRKRSEWMGEFALTVADYAKKKMPGITVEHNYACAVAGNWTNGSSELVNESCDFTGGDLYGDLYNHSFTAKYYMNVTQNQPFEYMTSRVIESLAKHTLTKTERSLGLEVMLTAAHHGASFIIDAVDPRVTMDRRVYERIGRVFDRQIPYEPYMNQGKHIEDIGVFYSTTGRYNPYGDPYDSKTASVAAVRTLIGRHVPVGVLSNGYFRNLKDYKAILLPMGTSLFDEARKALIRYVKEGGKLYFSGVGEPELLKEFLDAETEGVTPEKNTYVSPTAKGIGRFSEFTEEYPMPADIHHPLVKIGRGEIWGTLTRPYTVRGEERFASIHSDPPGIFTAYPSVVSAEYGEGRVIWSASPIEAFDAWQYRDILMGFVSELAGDDRTLESTAGSGVELVGFRTEKGFLISAVDLLSGDEDINSAPFTVRVKTDRPMKATLLPDGKNLNASYENGKTVIRLEGLHQFLMMELS